MFQAPPEFLFVVLALELQCKRCPSPTVLLLASHLSSGCFHFTFLCKGSCHLATRFRSLREQANCLDSVRRLSRNRGGVFREALREPHKLRQPFVLHLWEVVDVPPLSRHRNNNSKSPEKKDALNHSLNLSRSWGMPHQHPLPHIQHLDDKKGCSRKERVASVPHATAELLTLPLCRPCSLTTQLVACLCGEDGLSSLLPFSSSCNRS